MLVLQVDLGWLSFLCKERVECEFLCRSLCVENECNRWGTVARS